MYNAGVIVVNLKVVGLALGFDRKLFSCIFSLKFWTNAHPVTPDKSLYI
jgi:hypothetical protein